MANVMQDDNIKYFEGFAQRLKRELAVETDEHRRVGLLHALARIVGDRLNKADTTMAGLALCASPAKSELAMRCSS